jgi:hypothetical protein
MPVTNVTKLTKTTRFTRLYCTCDQEKCAHSAGLCQWSAICVADVNEVSMQLCNDCLQTAKQGGAQ